MTKKLVHSRTVALQMNLIFLALSPFSFNVTEIVVFRPFSLAVPLARFTYPLAC